MSCCFLKPLNRKREINSLTKGEGNSLRIKNFRNKSLKISYLSFYRLLRDQRQSELEREGHRFNQGETSGGIETPSTSSTRNQTRSGSRSRSGSGTPTRRREQSPSPNSRSRVPCPQSRKRIYNRLSVD